MLYNFIIADDHSYFLDLMVKTVEKTSKIKGYNCNIYKFNDYNNDFFNYVYKDLHNKVYILDIETPSCNGIEVAQIIRKNDEVSTIIFVSAYEDDYIRSIFKSDSNYFCSVSKKELEVNLEAKLIKLFNSKKQKSIKIKTNDCLLNIAEEDIVYIFFEDRKSHIITLNNTMTISKPLNDIYKLLSDDFVYSHQACIINMNKVIDYSYSIREIKFNNGIKTDLISRKYMANLDNYYKSK